MAELTIERARVHWGAAVAGAFFAVAIAIVLGLFGAAFARAGFNVLAGVWQILTPLVAGFVGAAVAASFVGRRGAYLNGLMVWALGLAYAVVLATISARSVGTGAAAGQQAVGASAGMLALGGLAAILGLVGALIGSAVAGTIERRIARRAEERPPSGERAYREPYTVEQPGAPVRGTQPAEPPEMRH